MLVFSCEGRQQVNSVPIEVHAAIETNTLDTIACVIMLDENIIYTVEEGVVFEYNLMHAGMFWSAVAVGFIVAGMLFLSLKN